MMRISKDINRLSCEGYRRRLAREGAAVGSFYHLNTPSLPGGLQNRQALPAKKYGAAVSE
jgi:hypothetical protein